MTPLKTPPFSTLDEALAQLGPQGVLDYINDSLRLDALARQFAGDLARDRPHMSMKEIQAYSIGYRTRVVLCFHPNDPRSDGRPLQYPWLHQGSRGECLHIRRTNSFEVHWDHSPGRTCSVGYEGFLVPERFLLALDPLNPKNKETTSGKKQSTQTALPTQGQQSNLQGDGRQTVLRQATQGSQAAREQTRPAQANAGLPAERKPQRGERPERTGLHEMFLKPMQLRMG